MRDLTLFADRFACGSPLAEPCFDFGRCSTTSGLYVHDANCCEFYVLGQPPARTKERVIFDYRIGFQAYVFWHVFDILFSGQFLVFVACHRAGIMRLFLRFLRCLVTSGYFIEVLERHGLPGGFWTLVATNFRITTATADGRGVGACSSSSCVSCTKEALVLRMAVRIVLCSRIV